MRAPCAADLGTARELLEHGVVEEGAQKLVDLRHCAQDCGCTDWQSCTHKVEGTWVEAAAKPGPDADVKPDEPASTDDLNRLPAAGGPRVQPIVGRRPGWHRACENS